MAMKTKQELKDVFNGLSSLLFQKTAVDLDSGSTIALVPDYDLPVTVDTLQLTQDAPTINHYKVIGLDGDWTSSATLGDATFQFVVPTKHTDVLKLAYGDDAVKESVQATLDGFNYSEPDVEWNKRPEIDRWILSLLNSLVKDVDSYLEAYEPTRAGRAISDFVNDNLSNWYVRLNRRRFWGGGMTEDKLSAYQTLYTCLETVAKLMAPIAPFYADKLFCDLIAVTGREDVTSVHLSNFPTCDESKIDARLEERMGMAQEISSMVLALRRKVNIKVRQPLHTLMIPVMDMNQEENIEAVKGLILNEVNVKELKFVDNAAGVLVKRIKPDFKKLGPRYGKIMKKLG